MKRMRSAVLLGALAVALGACKSREERIAAAIEAMASDDSAQVAKAQTTLRELGAAATVPALARALGHADPRVRNGAGQVLWSFGPTAKEAVPALAVALADSEPGVRLSAAMSLEAMGPEARQAVPALVLALGDSDGNVRLWAVKALGAVGRDARSALPALTRTARHDSLRQAADDAIRRIQSSSP
jgi:HEAT repeat protein